MERAARAASVGVQINIPRFCRGILICNPKAACWANAPEKAFADDEKITAQRSKETKAHKEEIKKEIKNFSDKTASNGCLKSTKKSGKQKNLKKGKTPPSACNKPYQHGTARGDSGVPRL